MLMMKPSKPLKLVEIDPTATDVEPARTVTRGAPPLIEGSRIMPTCTDAMSTSPVLSKPMPAAVPLTRSRTRRFSMRAVVLRPSCTSVRFAVREPLNDDDW
jgi:hypothetical protein